MKKASMNLNLKNNHNLKFNLMINLKKNQINLNVDLSLRKKQCDYNNWVVKLIIVSIWSIIRW